MAYTATPLSVGGDATRDSGKSERLVPLFLGMLVLASAIGIRAWTTTAVSRLPPTTRRLDRLVGWWALVVAVFLTDSTFRRTRHTPGSPS